ncbi:hypothetical protein HD553DRAFT_342771 [Filobasidium floriforme]|uniref:uncharacterized protein n=1 Tax=Filobasidium floriforme TaxID=5210 RepID=UPI001E8D9E74|nr:uncharacterized protein HD553DRAFT_342771 [Filobasidium floriforme]KAH8083544.1 hypothetical protein HD553DRAFT_342771 [Filobasidium floriforme]
MASVTAAEAGPPQDLFGTTETAASRVAANSLLMSTIFDYVDEPHTLLDCMLMSREQFPIAARALYRSVEEDDILALWRRGCSLKRFQLYVGAVRILRLHRIVCADEVQLYMQQYEALQHIRAGDQEPSLLQLEELYTWQDREIRILGYKLKDVPLIQSLRLEGEEGGLVPVGFLAISWDGDGPEKVDGSCVRNYIVNAIKDYDKTPSWLLDHLTTLDLPNVNFDVKSLETVLIGCPKLVNLRCSMELDNDSLEGFGPDCRKKYHEALVRLMGQHGARLYDLSVRCRGDSIFSYMSSLSGPRTLRLSGFIEESDSSLFAQMVTNRIKHKDTTTRRVILKPNSHIVKKNADQPISPYEAAKLARSMSSSSSVIQVEYPIAVSVGVKRWVDQLSSILKTLEREDDIVWESSKQKGWHKIKSDLDSDDR